MFYIHKLTFFFLFMVNLFKNKTKKSYRDLKMRHSAFGLRVSTTYVDSHCGLPPCRTISIRPQHTSGGGAIVSVSPVSVGRMFRGLASTCMISLGPSLQSHSFLFCAGLSLLPPRASQILADFASATLSSVLLLLSFVPPGCLANLDLEAGSPRLVRC